MPTKKVSVTTSESEVLEPNTYRTGWIVFNLSSTQNIYLSDQSGKANSTSGWFLPPRTTLAVNRGDGEEPEKALRASADATSNLCVWEFFRPAEAPAPPGGAGPTPTKDPAGGPF